MTGRAASAMRASGQARRSIVQFNQGSCVFIIFGGSLGSNRDFGKVMVPYLPTTCVQGLGWRHVGISKQIHYILVGVFREEVQHAVRQNWLARSIFHVFERHIDCLRGT